MTPRGRVVFSAVGFLAVVLIAATLGGLNPENADSGLASDASVREPNTAPKNTQTELDTDEGIAPDLVSSSVSPGAIIGQGGAEEPAEGDAAAETAEMGSGDTRADSDLDGRMEALYNAKATVYFDPDVYELKDEYRSLLNEFADIARQYPDNAITVEGNINGYPKFNDSKFGKELSQIRASMVAQYLMNLGIESSRITVVSNGSAKPLHKSDSAEELMLNRRADVYFTDYEVPGEIGK